MTFTPYGGVGPLQRQAATPAAGFALTGGTPTILTWTAPNDGALHRVELFGSVNSAGGAAGGAIGVTWTDPGGNVISPTWITGGQGSGFGAPNVLGSSLLMIKAGTTVTIAQTSPLSAGTETLWAEIWGS